MRKARNNKSVIQTEFFKHRSKQNVKLQKYLMANHQISIKVNSMLPQNNRGGLGVSMDYNNQFDDSECKTHMKTVSLENKPSSSLSTLTVYQNKKLQKQINYLSTQKKDDSEYISQVD